MAERFEDVHRQFQAAGGAIPWIEFERRVAKPVDDLVAAVRKFGEALENGSNADQVWAETSMFDRLLALDEAASRG